MKESNLKFGRILAGYRAIQSPTAKSFWSAHQDQLGYKYGKYSRFESGEALPEAKDLRPLAQALKVDPEVLYLQWAACSVSESGFDGVVDDAIKRLKLQRRSPSLIDSVTIPSSEFDNTWVLSRNDIEVLERHFSLFRLLVTLELFYPEELPFAELGFEGKDEAEKYLQDRCPSWLLNGNLVVSNRGLMIRLPHFYLPKTQEWVEVRARIISDFVKETLPRLTPENIRAGRVHRTMTSKVLSEEEVRLFAETLKTVEQDFSKVQRRSRLEPGTQTYSILMLLAPRNKWSR